MKHKLRTLAIGVGIVLVISGAAYGIVSADSTSTSHSRDIGSSGIPRLVFREELLDSTAQVLNTSAANVKAAHQDHTLSALIKNAGLTRAQFLKQLKADLTSDLESKGYTSQQITIATERLLIKRLHHRLRRF